MSIASTYSNYSSLAGRQMKEGDVNRSEPVNVDPVGSEVVRFFLLIILVIGCGLVSLLGIGSNIVNIFVFIRQGFKDSVNISLFGLAVADLVCVLSMFWISFSCCPFFVEFGLPFNGHEMAYMTGTWTRLCSNRIASLISAFISLERCLCIAIPLKVKNIITPQKTRVIIVSIFIFTVVIFSPFYYVNKLEWRLDHSTNRTLLTLVFTEDRVLVETVTFPFHSVSMSVASLLCVVVCTIVLVVKLNQKAKWRQQNLAKNFLEREDEPVSKEQKIMKMVTFISAIFIACYTPATVTFVLMTCEPQLSITGLYRNTFYIVWSMTVLLETISSSVNIFVYLNMSSKFKVTLFDTFCRSMTL